MKQFCIEIGDLVSPFSKKMENREATILYSICYLSVHLKLITQSFNICHPLSRVGWIVDPVKILSPIHPKLNISAALKTLTKNNFLIAGEKPYRVLPNLEEIEKLKTILPFAIQTISDNVFYAEDVKTTLTNQEYWDHIPGVSDGLPPITLKKYVQNTQDIREWAKQYKLLDNHPIHIIEVAKIVFEMTGFIPDQKDYTTAYLVLYEASGKNLQTLREGIEYANNLKKKNQMILNHPRSYLNFVKEIAAKKRITDQSIVSSVTKKPIRI